MNKTFNDEELIKFIESFDFISFKYKTNNSEIKMETQDKILNYELGQQTNHLYKKNFGYIYDDVKLVYGNETKVNSFIKIFNLTEQKIINQYLNIPGLNQMFSDKYFDFEWDMHTGRNFDEHKCDYYRDHFIHQVRDMGMVVSLINDFGFYDSIKKILSDRNISKISNYCYINESRFLDDIRTKNSKRLLLEQCAKDLNVSENEYYNDYYYHYIINSSCMMAALFHDIGYPMRHFIRVRNRVSGYMPSMYMFTHNDSDDFDRVASILNNSLLFQIVDNNDIKNRLSKNNNYDHGAYSAIAFLMQFYDAGLIYSLQIEERVAVELAAVAIFNHTLKYNIQSGDKGYYFQPVYALNPIAYILRLCDDTQEWNRIYLEFSEHGDVHFCEKCKTPYLKKAELFFQKKDQCTKCYKCACQQSFRTNVLFSKRRLYLVETSKNLTINNESNGSLIFRLDYDLFLLLRMSYINGFYAKYRIKELNAQKLIMEKQSFYGACSGMYLHYFISSNPLLLKTEILRRFLAYSKIKVNSFSVIDDDFSYRIYKEYFGRSTKENFYKKAKKKNTFEFYFNRSIKFYANIIKLICDVNILDKYNSLKELTSPEYFDFGERNAVDLMVFKELLNDVFDQYEKIYNAFGQLDMLNTEHLLEEESYHQLFSSKDSLFDCVNSYCDIGFIDSYNENKIDYFSDLYLFEKLNDIC